MADVHLGLSASSPLQELRREEETHLHQPHRLLPQAGVGLR
jgi:hypothetical protein